MSRAVFPLIGRDTQLARVVAAIREHQPLLLLGPHGSGKSALIDVACSSLSPAEVPVRVSHPANQHDFLVKLAAALLQASHRGIRRSLGGASMAVERQTSVHLRGVLWQVLKEEPRSVIIEDIVTASAPLYRFLQPLYHADGMSVIGVATSRENLGFLSRLFWDPRGQIELKPLTDTQARSLAGVAAAHFGTPAEVEEAELREQILEAAGGIPGRIIEMYRMASDARYYKAGYVKLGLIQIDLAARFA